VDNVYGFAICAGCVAGAACDKQNSSTSAFRNYWGMSSQLLSTPPTELRQAFLSLKSPRDVAKLLDYRYSALVYQIYKTPDDKKYITFEISKKSGGIRTITSPSPVLKLIQRRLAEVLQNIYKPKPVVYGFVQGKNIVDNANRHKKKNWVLNIDLENFFPSINFGRVRGMFMGKPYNLPESVSTILAQICCYKNDLPQGAPTSPIISNMICSKMDSELQDLAWTCRCFYTRYADDITFSTTLHELPVQIAKAHSLLDVEVGIELENIIKSNGFKINHNKTRAFSHQQRQEVTGLTVNKFPNVRRKYIAQIRAMLHAWDKYGLQATEEEHFNTYNQKHRNPKSKKISFKYIVRGKIEFLGLVKGCDKKVYKDFKDKYRQLSRRNRGIPLRNVSPKTESSLTIYTEGITDKLILETAWKKLYGDKFLFTVSSVELKPSVGGGTTGLVDELNSHRKQHGIIIGIFDRDTDGIKSYNRDLHSEYTIKDDYKISEERRAAAFLLPIPDGKKKLAELEKLWIENYFSEMALGTKTEDGKGLLFEYKPKVTKEMIGDKVISETKVEEKSIETAIIKDGKKDFAKLIVPTLPIEEFEGFKLVFEKINQIVELLQQKNSD
jgi:RNA-directed DNA polymerase